jgi:outer membrane protein assembly factor BamB
MEQLDLVFVGTNGQVVALDRATGQTVWRWKYGWRAWMISGLVSLIHDQGQLFVSVNGWVFCLDARTGEHIWSNSLKGMGWGHTAMTTTRTPTTPAASTTAIRAAAPSH